MATRSEPPPALPSCSVQMVQRVTYRRRKSFRTASNAVRKVKTPGGKLVLHYMGKKGKGVICGDSSCSKRLHGVRLRPCPMPHRSPRPVVVAMSRAEPPRDVG